jgi:hypothetical protein
MMNFRLELGCGASGEKFVRVHVEQIEAADPEDAIWKAQAVIVGLSEFISPTLVLLFNGSSMLVWSQARYREDTGDGLHRGLTTSNREFAQPDACETRTRPHRIL